MSILDDLTCGASIYEPTRDNRDIVDCEVILSPSAVLKLKELMGEEDLALFIKVRGGGCSGYLYEMELQTDEPTSEHQIITQEGIRIAVPFLDSTMLNGCMIEYEEKLMGGGFKVHNPNATRSCGCGLSFG